jgi:hypothetical protein
MTTRWAAALLSVVLIVVMVASAWAQGGAPAPDQSGTSVAPAPPQRGDEAAQRTIFGPTHRVTVYLGAILVVLALGLFVAGIRRGPRAARRAPGRRDERGDRAA